MKNLLMALIAIVSCTCLFAQTVDPTYPATVTSASGLAGGILLSDGKYILYGEFSHLNGVQSSGIAKFNADGSVDNTFNIGTGPNGSVMAAAVQADGKILLAGRFTSFNGVNRSFLTRLNADGSVDNTFAPNINIDNGGVDINLLVQPDGKILVTGSITTIDGVSYGGSLARLHTNGSRDVSFNSTTSQVLALGMQADGKILIGGTFEKGIARLNSDGTGDPTFSETGTGFDSWVYAIQVSSTGQIFVGGSFTEFNGTTNKYLACLGNTGALDAAWQGNGKPNNVVKDFFLLPDDKLLVAGAMSNYGGTAAKSPWRLNTDGSRDASLTAGGGFGVEDITANADGDILITGSFTTYDGQARNGVAALESNGTLKSMSLQPNFQNAASVNAIHIHGTDKFLIGHQGDEVNGTPSTGLVQLNLDGTIDATFNGNAKPNASVNVITIDQNDKIIIGGSFSAYNGITAGRIARLLPTGDLDAAFTTNTGTGFNLPPSVIVEQPDGKILVGGRFASFNGTLRKGIARLNADGTLDASFNTADGFAAATSFSGVNDIAVLSDGKILVAGDFNSFNGNTVENFIRLNSDGSFDNTFQIGSGVSGSSNYVEDVLVLPNGKILIGGMFRNVGNATSNASHLALLSSNGTLENGYGSMNFFGVEHMEIQSDGKILVLDRNTGMRRLNADGTVHPSFTGVSLDSYPEGVVISGNTLIVGGWLSQAQGHIVAGFAKIDLPAAAPMAPSALAATAVAQTSVSLSWSDNGTDETGFELERSTGDNSNYQVIAALLGNVTSYENTGLSANTHYFYRLRTFNATGSSAYSNELSVITPMVPPTAPSSLAITVVTAGEITLTWTDNSSNESGFEIYRSSPSNTSYTLLTTTTANATTYSDLAVSNGTRYYYKVRAINSGGASAYTTHQSAIAADPVPVTPTNLALTSVSPSSISISWVDNASDEVDYVIERAALNPVDFSEMAVLAANTTQYTDAGLTPGSLYFYRLRARNAYGSSAVVEGSRVAGDFNMGSKSITTCEGNLFDFGYYGTYNNNESYRMTIYPATAGSSVELAFSSFSTEAADELKIYDGVTINADSLIGVYSGTTSPGTVRAVNGPGALTLVFQSDAAGVSSGWSAAISCGIFPAPPSNILLDVPHASEVTVSWIDNARNETGYVVERSLTGVDSDFTTLATLNADVIEYSDNQVTENTTYYYRVKAMGSDNGSAYAPTRGVAFGDGGIWRLRQEFDGIARTDAVGFAVGAKGYLGLGWAGGAQTGNFGSYDPSTDSWSTDVDFFGGSVRSEAAAFVVGTKAYAGTGEWLDRENDLWEYDPATNTWAAKADFGGTARTGAIGFAIGDKGYIGLGRDDAGYTKDFWQFDPAANTWTPIASFPGDARNGAVVFVIGNFAYAGTGYNGTTRLKDFYKYDPASNTWSPIAAFPGAARRHAVAFAAAGKGYVGTGDSGSDQKDFWSYDPATDTWQEIVNFGGTARSVATSFTLNNKGYVTTGFDGGNTKDLWEFTPANIQAAPIPPSDLSADAISSSQIDLHWTDNSADETGFVIERSAINSDSFQEVVTLPVNATSYSDTGLDPATTYYYRVKINSAIGSSPYTIPASAITLPLPPAAPSNLTASLGTALQIQLAWNDNADNETQYVIERSAEDNSNFSPIATLSAGLTSYTDAQISYSTTYYYRIRSANEGGSSGYSNETAITTGISPVNAPGALTAEALSASAIRLRWTDNSDNETLFTILRATDPSGAFLQIGFADPNTTEYVDSHGLVENTTYYYRIRAGSAEGDSDFTAIASATTLKSIPVQPNNLTATYDESLDDIVLAWVDASSNEEYFRIERSFDGSEFTELTTTTGTTYTDENPGTTFQVFYRVAAVNNGGSSAFSNVAQIIITGLEPEAGIGGLKTYPIPVVNQLTLEFSSPERGEVHVSFFDPTGRELKAAIFEKNDENLIAQVELKDVAGHALLIMKLAIGEKIVMRKVVVK